MENNVPNGANGNPSTAVVVAATMTEFSLPSVLKVVASGVATSLDIATPVGRAKMYTAMMSDAKALKDFVNTKIKVSDILVHRAKWTDEKTGEIVDALRTVLILEDGSTIACMSAGVAKSLAVYSACFGPPPWVQPVEFTVRNTGKKDRVWYELQAVETAPIPMARRAK